jgi:hypothetical protein
MRSTFVMIFILGSTLAVLAQDPGTLSIDELEKSIENQHPSSYYILAKKLFESEKKDDAVFWFYAGQLRYRVYLAVNQGKLEPSGDPALFASLTEEVGKPLNEYAFGDISQLVKAIDAVIAWDKSHSNQLTPRDQYQSEYNEITASLVELRDEAVQNEESIRQTRTANGLENR